MVNHKEMCMGCGICEISCPVKAIKIEMSKDGFYRPLIDSEKCINCKLCDKMCPVDNMSYNDVQKGYSYQSFCIESLDNCASGGFAYDLSKHLIKDYNVCSVKYDNLLNKPVHVINSDDEDLKACRNSVYLQSYTVDAFSKILSFDKGVIIGSPCQISAVNNYLVSNGSRDRFILIDFFCHGVPSYNLWKKYIENNSAFFEKKPVVAFRSKKNGWGRFTLKFSNDETVYYSDSIDNKDIFFKMFLENMVLNSSCYDCPYHSTKSCADIRMGDLWGEKYKEDKKGVSGILVYTQKGLNLIDEIKEYGNLNEEKTETIIEGQLNEKLEVPYVRAKMMRELSSNKSLKAINSTTFFIYKFFRRIKMFVSR